MRPVHPAHQRVGTMARRPATDVVLGTNGVIRSISRDRIAHRVTQQHEGFRGRPIPEITAPPYPRLT